jgi:hypothetical protein
VAARQRPASRRGADGQPSVKGEVASVTVLALSLLLLWRSIVQVLTGRNRRSSGRPLVPSRLVAAIEEAGGDGSRRPTGAGGDLPQPAVVPF